jgi:hypothetical protein
MKRIIALGLFCTLFLTLPIAAADYYEKFDKDENIRAEPEEGHALVYVFRTATVGAAIKTWAFIDDELMMVSKPRAYSFAQVPAGKHLFWTKSENTSALELDVEAGKTYYLKVKIKMGINKARAKLVELESEEEIQKAFSKCSYVKPTTEGYARAQEIVANRMDRAVNKAQQREKNEKKD